MQCTEYFSLSEFKNLINVKLVPWGNAVRDGRTGRIQCQHDQKECDGEQTSLHPSCSKSPVLLRSSLHSKSVGADGICRVL